MSTLFTDNFNRADGSLGSNWTVAPGSPPNVWWTSSTSPSIVSNQADLTPDPSSGYVNSISTSLTSCWAQCTLKSLDTTGGDGGGPALRINTSTGALYYIACQTVGTVVTYVDGSGTFTAKASNATTWAVNDICYMEIQGTSGIVRKGGSGGTQIITFTASELSSGAVGIAGSGNPDTILVDDFSAGDFTSSGDALSGQICL